ncbi:MAG: DUF308 domain-containing protein [Eubacteriales bacterium]|nr:DUF308 domain-containing protein [Eubacteriales bacterium]
MKTFNCILGVFSILGAVYCMFFPGVTFLNTGWIAAILLGVYGICSIFEYFSNPARKEKKNNSGLISDGVIGLIIGIGSAVLSVIALFSTGIRAILDVTILLLFAFWLVYSGVAGIIGAVMRKKNGGKMWWLSLVLGIILILSGVYGATHPLIAAFSVGYMVGIELMIYGVRLIMSVFENNENG